MLYEDELTLVIPADHPLREFKKVSMSQAAELPMLLLGEEFQIRQIWQAQLANLGRRPQVQAELNNMAGILDSLPHTRWRRCCRALQKAHGSKACCGNPERAAGAAEGRPGVSRCAAPAGVDGIAAHIAGRSDECPLNNRTGWLADFFAGKENPAEAGLCRLFP
jgi:DNA-binding transcriptional LysR family regulator